MRPFVYRKYLDHAALEEIARYKQRAERAGDGDRNIKVGRGGIREIELFTQVLQVTYGAEHTSLRSPATLTALAALKDAGIIETTVHDDLDHAYRFLRMVEHRLQIVHQRQTHTLDASPDALDLSALRMGFDSRTELESTLSAHQDRVHAVYADLLAPPAAETDDGRRLFRLLGGELSDDEAVELLGRYGIADPVEILHLIRTLDEAPSLVQTRSTKRNLLAEVAAAAEPARVLNRLERIVTRSGAPASLYRTLLDTPPLRTQLVTLLDTGDLVTDRLSKYPEVFDFLVAVPPDIETHRTAWEQELDEIWAGDPSASADRVRRLRHIEEVKVLVEWLDGGDLATLQEKLSGLADACVARIMTWLRQETEPADAQTEWVVAALGKERDGDRFDLKVGRGGLADIDFLLQLLPIHHGATRLEWRVAGSRRLLAASPASPVLDADDWARLRHAHLFLRTLETRLRIKSDASASVLSTDPAKLTVLGIRMDLPDPAGDALRQHYAQVTGDVRRIFFENGIARLEGQGSTGS